MSDNSYQGQLQGPRRSAHDDFQPLGWGRSASWVNGPDQGRSSLTIDETLSIESIQGSVLFLMSNRFDRFDWIYSLSGSILYAQVFVRGRGFQLTHARRAYAGRMEIKGAHEGRESS